MRALVVMLVAACGSSHAPSPDAMPLAASGFDTARRLAELAPDEVRAYCTWEVATLGGGGKTVSCSSCDGDACTDWDVTVFTVDQCIEQIGQLAACGVTVGSDEACVLDQAADLCGAPVSCRPLDGCI